MPKKPLQRLMNFLERNADEITALAIPIMLMACCALLVYAMYLHDSNS